MTGTIRASFLKGYADLARTVGLDPLRMLDAAGIPRAALDDPDLRFPSAAARSLLEASSRAAEDFGLRLADSRSPSIWGPLNLVIREQPTVRDVILTAIRFSALHDEGTVAELTEAGDIAIFSLAASGPAAGPHRQATEMGLSQLTRLLRRHLGTGWRPLRICMVHGPPNSLLTHHRVLGRNLEFDADFNGVVFDRVDLDRPNPVADPEMTRHVERYAQGLMPVQKPTLPDQVHRTVVSLLPTGRCSVEDTAERLALDVRTLQRRLAEAGTGFHEIVQRARLDLADQYIEGSDRSLAEVADLMGFSALSALSRWHRSQYGQSPSARRATARGAAQ